jgi:hypothetical protein
MKGIPITQLLLFFAIFSARDLSAGPLANEHSVQKAFANAAFITAHLSRPVQSNNAQLTISGVQAPAATHLQNAARFLHQADSQPGSYRFAQENGFWRSFGDGTRRANKPYKQAIAELIRADQLGIPSEAAVKMIHREISGHLPDKLVSNREQTLLSNLKYVKAAGLNSPENLDRLTKGKAPRPTRGNPKHIGENVEVDHQVARTIAPQYENEVANLRLLPWTENRTKGAGHQQIQQKHQDRLNSHYRSMMLKQVAQIGLGGFLVGAGVDFASQIYSGEGVNWTSVGQSGVIGMSSGVATVILAQQIERKFGNELAKSVIAKNLLPGLARGSLSGAAASTGIGAAMVLAFVAKDFLTDQITADEAVIQSGIGLGSVVASVSAGIIMTWATAGTIAGSEVPIIGNIAGFVSGLAAGTVAYYAGNWYYEYFRGEEMRIEMLAFKKASSKWSVIKIENELNTLREEASVLRAQASATLDM